MKRFARFIKEEDGVTAIEYGLIGALIATAIIVAVSAVGSNVSMLYNTIATAVSSAVSNP